MTARGSYFLLKDILSSDRFNTLLVCLVLLGVGVCPVLAQTYGEVVVTNSYANIRSGPSTKYARIGRAYEGESFKVADIRPQWYRIMYKGRAGWVFANLVRFEQAAPARADIDRVSGEIEELNRRVDKVVEKITEASTLMAERFTPALKPQAQGAQGVNSAANEGAMQNDRIGVSTLRPVPLMWAFVPGGARLAAGDRPKGFGMLGAAAGCLAAGVYCRSQYRNYMDDYRDLTPADPPEEFENIHSKARSRRSLSNGFFYAAAGVYAFNILDYFVFLPRSLAGLEVKASPHRDSGGGQKINLSMSCSF